MAAKKTMKFSSDIQRKKSEFQIKNLRIVRFNFRIQGGKCNGYCFKVRIMALISDYSEIKVKF